MKIKRYALLIAIPCLILVLLAVFAARTPGAKAASAKSSCSWQVVSAPTAGQGTHLYSMAALSKSDIWSVGEYLSTGSGGATKTLIENWNGSQWSIIPSPSIGKNDNSLGGAAAVSTNDVWAVGSAVIGSPFQYKVLIEHWNGTKWYVMPGPVPSQEGGGLSSVSVVSANDIWAVGTYYNNGFTNYTLAAHWDGKQWNMVSTPNPQSGGNYLNSVVALSSTDVWAVGGSFSGTGAALSLVEHWDGTQWSVISSPNPGAGYNDLSSVSAVSANDIWAVGDYYNRHKSGDKTLVEHWDGTQWSVVSSPSVNKVKNSLSQVAALSATNIWAVGYTEDQGRLAPEQTLIEHWDGTNWRITSSPNPGSNNYNILNAVTGVPGSSQVWTIGTEGLYYGDPLTAYC